MAATECQPIPRLQELRPEIQRIIAAGKPARDSATASIRTVVALTTVSLALLWLSFTPVECAAAAWVSLVPLGLIVRIRKLPGSAFPAIWFLGFLWGLATLQWMRLGHPAMYLALAALAAWTGLFMPVFVSCSRRVTAAGIPVWLTIPMVWTALEYARAWLLTGFSWYYLGHSQYQWIALIQIADITGAYGVSFIVALVSGVLAELLPTGCLRSIDPDAVAAMTPAPQRRFVLAAVPVVIVAGCLVYGTFRQLPPESFTAGPVFALIQGNFSPEVKHDPGLTQSRYRVHDALTTSAIGLQPDLIVWPETMFSWPEQSVAEGVSNEEILAQIPAEVVREYGSEADKLVEPFRNHEVQRMLTDYSRMCGAAMVIGLQAMVAEKSSLRTYNSAAVIRPDTGYAGRYDKIHRVIFGEYIPLKDLFPWLTDLTPFGAGFGLDAGHEVRLFEYAGARFAPLICFEDTVPHLVRRMAAQTDAAGQKCDVLVNLTNDAWFRGSSELDQHLITSAFRAVENRMPLVRAVNGGISAFIDGNGEIREPAKILKMKEPLEGLHPEFEEVHGLRDPESGTWRRQFSGIIFGQAPLDPRSSLYLRFGDWFAIVCSSLSGLALVASFFRPQKTETDNETQQNTGTHP